MTLFNQPLLTVNPLEMMKLWGELVECYHGVNGYGSDTAEIYAYRLTVYNPLIHDLEVKSLTQQDAKEQSNITSARALVALLELFKYTYGCKITIDGYSVNKWLLLFGGEYSHRCHVKVVRK